MRSAITLTSFYRILPGRRRDPEKPACVCAGEIHLPLYFRTVFLYQVQQVIVKGLSRIRIQQNPIEVFHVAEGPGNGQATGPAQFGNACEGCASQRRSRWTWLSIKAIPAFKTILFRRRLIKIPGSDPTIFGDGCAGQPDTPPGRCQ